MSLAALRSSIARTNVSLLIAAVASACNLQEPAPVDGLGPDPALDTLVITPQAVNVPPGDSIAFVAPDETIEGTDVSGPVEWTVSGGSGASITTTGLFRATAPGDYIVKALRSGHTGRSRATVAGSVSALTAITIAPGSVTLQPGGAFTFAVSGVRADGTTVPVSATWTATRRHGCGRRNLPRREYDRTIPSDSCAARWHIRRHCRGNHQSGRPNSSGGRSDARERHAPNRCFTAVFRGRTHERRLHLRTAGNLERNRRRDCRLRDIYRRQYDRRIPGHCDAAGWDEGGYFHGHNHGTGADPSGGRHQSCEREPRTWRRATVRGRWSHE